MAIHSLLGYKIPIDGGGISTVAKGGWYGIEFFGYRYRTVEVYGTFSATFNLEITLDPNSILIDNAGNIKPGAIGHADVATIPAYVVVSGATAPGVYDLTATPNVFLSSANIVAIRINVTGSVSGTVQANMTTVK